MSTEKPNKCDKSADGIDHKKLLEMLADEMGVLARLTEEAMDKRQFEQVDRYVNFINRVRANATPEVRNAIDVSYLEFLAFSEVTENRLEAMKRLPHDLRAVVLEIDARGRWE